LWRKKSNLELSVPLYVSLSPLIHVTEENPFRIGKRHLIDLVE
jgi:hypothetical protein